MDVKAWASTWTAIGRARDYCRGGNSRREMPEIYGAGGEGSPGRRLDVQAQSVQDKYLGTAVLIDAIGGCL